MSDKFDRKKKYDVCQNTDVKQREWRSEERTRAIEWHKNRSANEQLSVCLAESEETHTHTHTHTHFSETVCVSIQRSQKFPVGVQTHSSLRCHWSYCTRVCRSGDNKRSLAAQHTHNTAKHDWNSISGKVHVSDAKSKARTELGVCVLQIFWRLVTLSLFVSDASDCWYFLLIFLFSNFYAKYFQSH